LADRLFQRRRTESWLSSLLVLMRYEVFADAECHTRFILSRQFVLPDAKQCPPRFPQRAIHQPVACFISSEFLSPEQSVGRGFCRVPWATVPETTIDEHG